MTQAHMGNIVTAFSMPHTPGLGNRVSDCPPAQLGKIMAAFSTVRSDLEAKKPDVIIAFINDHFDMHVLENLPTFAIGVSDKHHGPSEDVVPWLGQPRRSHPGAYDYALDILNSTVRADFDMARIGSSEFNHNVLIPKKYLWPETDIPIVPIFINCFTDPLPSWERCYKLGREVRKVIDRRSEKVGLFASGGLSHWPPFVKEDAPKEDELLQRQLKVQRYGSPARAADPTLRVDFQKREAEMSFSDRVLINEEWDREVLAAIARADVPYMLKQTHEEVERLGGIGGHEMMLWAALVGAMNDRPGDVLVYEAVKEWMGGVGIIHYT